MVSSRERMRRPTLGSVATENRALFFALVALVVSTGAGITVFAGEPTALFGEHSVGVTAAAAAGLSGAVAFLTGYLRSPRAPHDGAWRRAFDAVVLTVSAAGIVALLTGSVFAVFDLAFRELRLDALMAAALVGVSATFSAYVLTLVSFEVTSVAIANLLALLLVSGALASMLSANDPYWWHVNFSALGVGKGFSAYAFNITLVFAGLVMTTLTHYVIGDLRIWAMAQERRRLDVLRTWLIVVGVLLVALGVVTVGRAEVLHTAIASTMTVLFAGLIIATPYLVPRLPRSFIITSAVFVSAFAVIVLLMWPVGYFNVTAVEFLGFSLLLTWLFMFVRAVAAQLRDDRRGGDDRTAPNEPVMSQQ